MSSQPPDDRYHEMWERSLAVMLLIDPTSLEIVDANPAAAGFYGYPLEVLRTMRMTDINTLPREEILAQVSGIRDEGQAPFRFRHRLASGEIRDVRALASLITVDGRELGFSIINDVTHEQAAVEQARQSDRKFRTLVEHMPAITYAQSLDADPELFYISPQTEEIFGFPPERWFDPGFWETRIHPDDFDRVTQEDAVTDTTGKRFSVDYRFLTADGRVVWVRDRADLVAGADGRPMWQGFIQDITEQKEAEERFRGLVEQLPAATYRFRDPAGSDEKGGLLYVSPQIEPMLGYPLERWFSVGWLWGDIVDARDRERIDAAQDLAASTGHRFREEFRVRSADDREVWVAVETTVIVDEPGRPREWLGVVFDVTDRRRADEELQRSFDRLRAADAERRHLLSRIVEAQEGERRRIASDIHDDPIQKMTAVGLRLETLSRHVHDPEGAAILDALRGTVTGAIARMRHLLFELYPPALERDGLSAAVRDALREMEAEVGVETHLEDRLVADPSDDVRAVAYRIASEALTNVRKHAAASRVDVLLESRSDGVVVRVRDDGRGFAQGAAPPAGHLGIPAMRERAEMIGGRVRIETSPEGGTRVEAWLPDRPTPMIRPA